MEMVCRFSPLVFAEIYHILNDQFASFKPLLSRLENNGLSGEWLLEAEQNYREKWESIIPEVSQETANSLALSDDHAEFASFLLASLESQGSSADFSTLLISRVNSQVKESCPTLSFPLPGSFQPEIIGWTLGQRLQIPGALRTAIPALMPYDEDAREAFMGLVNHFYVLQELPQPWPEMMCSSLYWRGYGIAEALRADTCQNGNEAIRQLQAECNRFFEDGLRQRINRHLNAFGEKRNTLSHVAKSPNRARFVEVIAAVCQEEEVDLTMKAITQFVFREVTKQMNDPKSSNAYNDRWDNALRWDLEIY
ncbi:hypothetical protein BSR28_06935 [Boudabousia liubingyangii]|nr:hypothetical protein BSR28_06935 [Boudabousia liubingyangii]